jgi:hypothetical protein
MSQAAGRMRVASFNVQNLFERAVALVPSDWSKGRPALEAYARINRLLNRLVYTPADKAEIAELLRKLGLNKKDDGGKYAQLRQNRDDFLPGGRSGVGHGSRSSLMAAVIGSVGSS